MYQRIAHFNSIVGPVWKRCAIWEQCFRLEETKACHARHMYTEGKILQGFVRNYIKSVKLRALGGFSSEQGISHESAHRVIKAYWIYQIAVRIRTI